MGQNDNDEMQLTINFELLFVFYTYLKNKQNSIWFIVIITLLP